VFRETARAVSDQDRVIGDVSGVCPECGEKTVEPRATMNKSTEQGVSTDEMV
jgi:hypothetical protein